MADYYWIRVYDYDIERDSNSEEDLIFGKSKGILLDEFYLSDIDSRDKAKEIVLSKYFGKTKEKFMFAKPKKGNGVYAIVMKSNKFFYDRFTRTIDSHCFWHECHKEIKGRYSEFPKETMIESGEEIYFCSYDCRRKFNSVMLGYDEGEFQEKELGMNGEVYGYVYQIYNRVRDCYYIGQTKYLPFFRWQEHIKAGQKGNICDMVFSVLAEVRRQRTKSEEENKQLLNDVEAWWINKHNEEGSNTANLTKPKLTLEHMKEKYVNMISNLKEI